MLFFLLQLRPYAILSEDNTVKAEAQLHNLGSVHFPEPIGCYGFHTVVRTFT